MYSDVDFESGAQLFALTPSKTSASLPRDVLVRHACNGWVKPSRDEAAQVLATSLCLAVRYVSVDNLWPSLTQVFEHINLFSSASLSKEHAEA